MSEEYKKALNYALRRISAQSYHSIPLSKLLLRKLFSEEVVVKVIAECLRLGYLNDKAWLENYFKSHSARQSHRAMVAKLRSKGIPFEEEDITEIDPESEIKVIQKLLISRYRQKDLNNFHEKQKVIAGLMRRGFAWESIQEALKAHFHHRAIDSTLAFFSHFHH